MTPTRFVVCSGFVFLVGLFAIPTPVETARPFLGAPVLQSLPVPATFPVDQFLAHWWVVSTSVLFSLVALSSGVSGALFFSRFSC